MEHRLYVYCDWLPIVELDALNGPSIVQKHTWGLDLAGQYGQAGQDGAASLTAAGGIGGLLATFDAGSPGTTGDDVSYIFCYDAHGNVGQFVDLSAETLSAGLVGRYEYDVYGNVTGPDDNQNGDWLEEAGPQAAANAYRFSTKPFDPDTGMGDWGHRYYDPRTGKWVSRDPIGERGGWNMYSAVGNATTNSTDSLGLACTIRYKCAFAGSTVSGKMRYCDYLCSEISRSDSVSGSDCDTLVQAGLLPPPGQHFVTESIDTKRTWARFWAGCGAPSCPPAPQTTRVLDDFSNTYNRNCSRATCKNVCQMAAQGKYGCRTLSGTLKVACQAAFALGEPACVDICNSWCQNP